MTYYTHLYYNPTDITKYKVIAHYDNGSFRPTDPHNEIDWIALGNTPAKVSGNRFISIENNEVIVNPEMDAILAAEQVQREAEHAEKEALEQAKAQAIVDGLPTWLQISTAIDNATTIAAMKLIIKKALRILYLWVKNSVD